ncbi:DUF1674-domain-containing protein [Teratosphaeria nubilosa]|uniref:Succinate dehydrogenase assembly factor 4, mitochondrial n=1 Tax=Teratosphaeria nubilosa TaxID=161662 RepID=A0A6G1L168_9PEZI|nr:DUF1674-domain-containing protein [Teratosphaeria nubilosa]
MQAPSKALRTTRPFFALRTFTSQPASRSRWTPGPAPPRLPKAEQELFEKLQQESTGAFSTPRRAEDASQESQQGAEKVASSSSNGDGEELHPNVRKGAAPEFEGDTNPKTGEVGGPKNDPLRWKGDWSYNGRVTDF